MFVETDGFVIVAVEQTFAVEPRLVDQPRQMNVAAEFFVRTARMQSAHDSDLGRVRGLRCADRDAGFYFGFGRFRFGQKFTLSKTRLSNHKLSREHSTF